VNRTRLKTSILENFPDAQEKNDGKNVVIIFKKAIQDIGKKVVYSKETSQRTL
jgi:RNase P protein component